MFVTRGARSKFPAGQVLAIARPGSRPRPPKKCIRIFLGPVRRDDGVLEFFVFSCLFPYAQSVKKPRFFYALNLKKSKIANPLFLRKNNFLVF
jgi:hypothetical protein